MKRFIFLSFFIILILGVASSVDAAELVKSGSCGTSLSWFYYDDGSLVISGSGAMNDYTASSLPWSSYISSITSLTLDDRITRIGNYAFQNLPLAHVDLPSSLVYIGSYAFKGSSLTSLVCPSSLKAILTYAFQTCPLTSVIFNEGLTTIYSYAFSQCDLSTVTIPSTVTALQDSAFSYNPLEIVYMLPTDPPTVNTKTFSNSSVLESIYVPIGTLEAYESTSNWSTWLGYLKVGSPNPVLIPDFSVITSWDSNTSYLIMPDSSDRLFSVSASISSDYTISYQWLSSLSSDGEFLPIEGQISSSFLPPSGADYLGTTFYKCQVTASFDNVSRTVDSPILEVLVSETLPDDPDTPDGPSGGSDEAHEEIIEILDSNNSLLSQIFSFFQTLGQNIGDWFSSLGSSVASGFQGVGNWFTAQTEAITSKLDEVISALTDGTAEQQQAAQQAQQNAAALDQQLGDISSGLQVNQPDQNEISGDVSSYLPADTANVLSSSFGSFISDPSVLPLFMISLTFCLVSFLIFGKRG